MSDSAADAGAADFTHLWKGVSVWGSKVLNTKKEQQMSTTETSPRRHGEFVGEVCHLMWVKSLFETTTRLLNPLKLHLELLTNLFINYQ